MQLGRCISSPCSIITCSSLAATPCATIQADAASGRRPGRRIVSVVENHAGVQTGFGIDRFAANKVEKLPAAARQIFGARGRHRDEVSAALPANAARTMVKGIPVETVWIGAEPSKSAALKVRRRAIAVRHRGSRRTPDSSASFRRMPAPTGSVCVKRTGTVPTFRSSRISAAPLCPAERKRCPAWDVRRMGSSSCTVKIRTRTPRVFFRRRVAGKDEGGLREIHFARQGLHLLGAQAAAVEKNRQRVSGEGAVGENIDLHHGEFSRRSSHG